MVSIEDIDQILADDDQLHELARESFNQVDVDGSGSIDQEELTTTLQQISQATGMTPPTEAQIKQIMNKIDQNSDGKISYDEYFILVRIVLEDYRDMLIQEQNKIQNQKKQEKVEEVKPVEADKEEEALRQAQMFEEYLNRSGISLAYQIIFGEVVKNKIESHNVFAYAAMRLRQIGKEVAPLLPNDLTANLNN